MPDQVADDSAPPSEGGPARGGETPDAGTDDAIAAALTSAPGGGPDTGVGAPAPALAGAVSLDSDVVVQATALPGRSAPGSRRLMSTFKRLGWGFWIAAGWVLIVILAAVLAPVLPIPNPNALLAGTTGCGVNSGPAAGHLLGCNSDGQDMFSRVIYGAKTSLIVGFSSIALALVVGGALAVVAGYIRGLFDSVTGVITNVILAYPYLVLAIAIVTFWGHSLFQVTVVIAIVAVAPLYRVVRANVIAFSERDYVLAARALGSTRRRILWRLIVPDVIPTAITYAFIGVALAIIGEGALSFLGLSVPLSTPTWGNLIYVGSQEIPSIGSGTQVNVFTVVGPAAAMFSFILAINVMGDRLRSLLDLRGGVL